MGSSSKFFAEEKKSTPEIPPQITDLLLPNGQLVSDELILEVKEAIKRICSKEDEQKMHIAKYRYYRKKELTINIGIPKLRKFGIKDGKMPYGVEYILTNLNEDGKELLCFKGLGLQGLDPTDPEDEEIINTKIFGVGHKGKVVPLHDINDPTKCYAVKISLIRDDDIQNVSEYEHATQAKLAIGRSIRRSPSHRNQWQERIYMYAAPGIELDSYMASIIPEAPSSTFTLPLNELTVLLRNVFYCVKVTSHQYGCIHRDVKFENFRINPKNGEIKFLDFELQVKTTDGKYIGGIGGTPGYIDPEIFRKGFVTQQADLYALGIMLAQLFTLVDASDLQDASAEEVSAIGYLVIDQPSQGMQAGIGDKEVCRYYFEFVKSLTNRSAGCRPKSIDECLDFFENLEKFLSEDVDKSKYRENIEKQLSYWAALKAECKDIALPRPTYDERMAEKVAAKNVKMHQHSLFMQSLKKVNPEEIKKLSI